MQWYDSTPISLVGFTLCALLAYVIMELLPSWMSFSMHLTFCAAVAAHCVADFKSKFPNCKSKIGVSILFAVGALAYAISQVAL